MDPDTPVRAAAAIHSLDVPAPEAIVRALDAMPGGVETVECALGDFTSVARGKWASRADFVSLGGCRLPSVTLGLTLTAGEPETVFGPLLPASYRDVHLVPDLATLAPRAGRDGMACVLCEPVGPLPSPRFGPALCASRLSPRAALRGILARLAAAGLEARVAPELEMFLVERRETDGRIHLQAPAARPGAPARERACESFSVERAAHFHPYFDALYAACRLQRIPVCGHAHEAAYTQFEVNFDPGEPLAQADAVFRFKRLAREVAAEFGFLATFAPKPFLDEPGTGMHWHFSLRRSGGAPDDPDDRGNAFAQADGHDRPELAAFLGGLQQHAPAAMALFAPHDMAYDRIALSDASPTTASWGRDDRGVAFRLPQASARNRRVENRLPGGDANPYLVVAATLGLGLWGIEHGLAASEDGRGAALPMSLVQACDLLEASDVLRELLGDPLVELYAAVKRHESAQRNACGDPRQDWDLMHLLELA